MSKAASSTEKAKAKTAGDELHCVRCHETFHPNDNGTGKKGTQQQQCIIEHDFDSFDGSRNGGSWYVGRLMCCGADYRFHRYYSDDKASPKYCFVGTHTTDPDEVTYNTTTIKICSKEDCGEELYNSTKEAYDQQREAKTRKRQAKAKDREAAKKVKQEEIAKLQAQGKSREARKLRAQVLGLDDDDLNSDEDPDGCAEFDYASDSSLVPPWIQDDDDDNDDDSGDY